MPMNAGDVNNDGKADIIVGSLGKDVLSTTIQKDAGGVSVINATEL